MNKSSIPTRQEISAALQPFVDKHLISGAVTLVANKDTVLSLDAVGYSDIAAKKPMTTDSVFWIASMTKPMTCAALMMLVDAGKVNVDDPVEKYLPEFKGQMVIAEKDDDHVLLKKPQHPILVREVLSHTSGLDFASSIETPTYDRFRLRDMTRSYAMTPLLFEPGTKYSYSNAGTNTVGRIVEVISGMPYEVFMDRHFFGPLGMNDTTFWPSEEQLGRLAKVYRPSDDKEGLTEGTFTQLSYPLQNVYRKPMPAGGLFSIASDVVKFCQMLLNGGTFENRRYLSEASVHEMTKRQTAPSIEKSYGFGLDANNRTFGHGGALKTYMTVDSKSGMIVVFLIHHNWDWPNEEGKAIAPAFHQAAEKVFASAS